MASCVYVKSEDEGSSGVTDSGSDGEEAFGVEEADGGFFHKPTEWIRDVLFAKAKRAGSNLLFSGMQGVLDIYADSSLLHERADPYPVDSIAGGPRPGDKVVVMGCGAAGAHMAKSLQALGCSVTVLEKDKIGGKACSRKYRDVVHEMGACYLSSDYEKVYQLLQEYEMTGQYNIKCRTMWTEEKKDGMKLKEWFYNEAKLANGTPDWSNASIASEIFMQTYHYISHHRRLLRMYENTEFLPPRPSAEHLRELQMPIAEFLRVHDLQALRPLFELGYTLQGYGFIEEEPLLYGMLWVTPTLINGMIEMLKVRKNLKRRFLRKRPKTSGPPKAITTLVDGFQTLVRKMVARCEEQARDGKSPAFAVHEDTKITGIKRSDTSVEVEYHRGFVSDFGQVIDEPTKTERFDFMVVAAPIPQVLADIDANDEEKSLFATLHESTFITTLVDYKPAKEEETSIDNWPENFDIEKPLAVWAARDSHHVARENGECFELEDHGMGSMVCYQYVHDSLHNDATLSSDDQEQKAMKERADAEKKLRSHLTHFGKTVEHTEQHRFRYFPRHSREAIGQGVLWDIMEMQGKYRTWYVGASMCFEAINAIVEYNDQLLNVWEKQRKEQVEVAAKL